ncbi:MAG: YjbQ family protein [Bacteroidales bacterium]|nr:YjbQ family protein [Bacteroidales bacterium]
MIKQIELTLPAYKRGYHIITNLIKAELKDLPKNGLVNLFIKHTSAAITINENADPTVTEDFERFMNKLIPDDDPIYKHTMEGPDDMAAHIKSSNIGQSLTIPITNNKINLGIWQGIYLCEFRNQGGNRKLVITIYY